MATLRSSRGIASTTATNKKANRSIPGASSIRGPLKVLSLGRCGSNRERPRDRIVTLRRCPGCAIERQLLIRNVEKAAVGGQSEAIARWLTKNDPGVRWPQTGSNY